MVKGTRVKNPIGRGNRGSNIGLRGIEPKLGLSVRAKILLGLGDMFEIGASFGRVSVLTTKLIGSIVWSRVRLVEFRPR